MVQDWSAILLGDDLSRSDWRGKIAKHFNPDTLNQRGTLCFNTYIMITADAIAALQFCLFVGVQQALPYNSEVFIEFSTKEAGSYEPLQQLAFVCAGFGLSYARYCATDIVSGRLYGITPTYVGTCHLSQFPRFRRTMVVVSSHVVSDVYLGMLLASIAGVVMVSECTASADGSTMQWNGPLGLPDLDLGKAALDSMCAQG